MNVEDLLRTCKDDFTTVKFIDTDMLRPQRNKKPSKYTASQVREIAEKRLKEELQNDSHVTVEINNSGQNDHYLDGYAYMTSAYYGKLSSRFNNSSNVSSDILDFIKNGKVLYRNIHTSNNHDYAKIDIHRVVALDEGYSINIVESYSYGKLDTPNISIGICFYHPISVKIPIDKYEQFFLPEPDKEIQLGLIRRSPNGYGINWVDHISEFEYSPDNYNEDFQEFIESTKEKLNNGKNGLVLLHGEAGTGKSSSIRYLMKSTDKKFIFLPPNMVTALSSPEFVDLVCSSMKECVLVIEDAEKALLARDSQDGFFNSEMVSTILNLTDGLYGDIAKLTICATFNCDRTKIDPALLRKGRLMAEYQYDKLTVDRAQKLADKLGVDIEVTKPMTLAEVSNQDSQYTNVEHNKPKTSIGFGR